MRNLNERIIHTYSVPAGGGKTHSLNHEAVKLAKIGEKVCFTQPSKALLAQTEADILKIDPTIKVTRIDGGTIGAGHVITSLDQHVKNTGYGGEILLTTHCAFKGLPYFHNKAQWTIFCDEVIEAYDHIKPNLSHNHSVITPYLEVIEDGPKYGRVKADPSFLDKVIDNRNDDDVYKMLTPLALRLRSPYWTVWVDQAAYQKLLDGQNIQLELFCLLSPELLLGFKKSVLASAALKDTLTYHIFQKMQLIGGKSFKFMNLKISNANLRYTEHENGDLIDFYYLTDRKWSKKLRKMEMKDPNDVITTVGDRAIDIIGAFMGSDPFAYTTNKDGLIGFEHMPNAHLLPNSPHGLNQYQWIDNFVCLSALNPPPSLESFFSIMLGMTAEQVITAIYRSFAYQAFMRTSPRDPLNTNKKKAVVLDKSTAQWFAGLFLGSRVNYLAGLGDDLCAKKGGRPQIYTNEADKVWASRYRQMREWADAVLALNSGSVIAGEVEWQARFCNETAYTSLRDIVTEKQLGTSITHKKAAYSEALNGDASAFIDLLRVLHTYSYPKKEHNILISPTVFVEKEGVETKRGLVNVSYVNGVWLDNDGGGISRHAFAQMFPHLEMHIWNTWSSTPTDERWRVYIPTDIAMVHDVQKLVIDQIMRVLKSNGYTDKKPLAKIVAGGKQTNLSDHGFDSTKFNASSFFFAPCQANHPQGTFYDSHTEKRMPLKVLSWIKQSISTATDCIKAVAPAKPSKGPSTQLPEEIKLTIESWSAVEADYVENAVAKWRKTSAGQGHCAFLGLGRSLSYAGLTKTQARQKLQEEARYARSPDERLRDIPDILEKVYGGKQGHLPPAKFGVKLKPLDDQEAATSTPSTPSAIVSIDHLPHAANSVSDYTTLRCA